MEAGLTTYCCERCFGDAAVQELVVEGGERRERPCDYCGSTAKLQVPVEDLSDAFAAMVLHIYETGDDLAQPPEMHPDLEYLHFLLGLEWGVFSECVRSEAALLSDILRPANPYDRKSGYEYPFDEPCWCRREEDWAWYHSGEAWWSLADAIERFGLSLDFRRAIPLGVPEDATRAYGALMQALPGLGERVPAGTILHRARRGRWMEADELLAPPPTKARAGRGNVAGQPVLYLADFPETALAEVRPEPGDEITLAQFRLRRELLLCALDGRPVRSSPFRSLEAFDAERRAAELRRAFADALARPVSPGDELPGYLPSQYLVLLR